MSSRRVRPPEAAKLHHQFGRQQRLGTVQRHLRAHILRDDRAMFVHLQRRRDILSPPPEKAT